MKVIITAGGTGGHIFPAISLINKLKEKDKNLEVLYIGTHNRMEKDIIPKLNIKYEELEIYGFTKDIKRDIKNIKLLSRANKKCNQIIKDFKPDVVIGFGGYVTYPVIKMAKKNNIPTFIHEQNSIPGKSNKLLAKYADIIGVTFEETTKYFKGKNVVLVGHPRSDEAKLVKKESKVTLGLNENKKLVVVVLGSLGSSSLNNKIVEYLHLVDEAEYEILYITGKGTYEKVNNIEFSDNVKILPFYDNLIGILKNTDVVISRAGSGLLNEIIALDIPSIIIPSPNVANNHQYYNAKTLSKENACLMMLEEDVTGIKLKNEVERLLEDEKFYNTLKNNIKKLEVINSTEEIYNCILKIMNKPNN